jgi:hypothetical protein
LKIINRERRERLLMLLLLTVAMFLLNASFKRVAEEKAAIKVADMIVVTHHKSDGLVRSQKIANR